MWGYGVVVQADQLQKIFSILGKPSVEDWPEIVHLPDWEQESHSEYPHSVGASTPSAPEYPFAARDGTAPMSTHKRLQARADRRTPS